MSKEEFDYPSATGKPMRNLGEKCLSVMLEVGSARKMRMQVVESVAKQLASVSRICAAGHRVVFDDDWSCIEHKETGKVTWLHQENGACVLRAWVAPLVVGDEASGFSRPGDRR